ncbi:MAG TPA: phospholipid carrier-dependent glycosyltransferase, partial [Mycobacteriales bacterium]|nr:phospholipid carrier-dependent glycosyltransferase [Mycobacteriales bacterium]
ARGPTGPDAVASGIERIRERLVTAMPTDVVFGWVAPIVVTLLGGFLRFNRLSQPGAVVFDETYYAHDAYSLLRKGVELNDSLTGPGYVVHPPLGKWMIAAGEALFGSGGTFTDHGRIFPSGYFGWRVSAAVVGTLAILVLARTARRMFRSTLLGCVAGLLLALDGLEFVQSRTSMLDIFLMFWMLAGFACLVADRDDGRRRLAERLPAGGVSGWGPWLGVRWWRVGAGVCLGAAIGTKWSGTFFLPAFLILAFAWDAGARRTAGVRPCLRAALVVDTLPSLVPFVVLPVAVYTASWTGWFLADGATAYDHDKYVQAGQSWLGHDWAVFRGWIAYQKEALSFHTGLDTGHTYKSRPFTWQLLARPVAYFYDSPTRGQLGCTVATCSREVLDIGTPVIWWAAIPALVVTAWRWISRHDWRAAAVIVCYVFAWTPWFEPDSNGRTMFLFYMLPAVPFMVLGLTLCIGWALGPARGGLDRIRGRAARRSASVAAAGGAADARRLWAAIGTGFYLLLVVANFSYLYPVLAAKTIPYSSWHDRMWFGSQCTATMKTVVTTPSPGKTVTSQVPDTTKEVAPCWI